MSFDRLAPHYTWMEHVLAGRRLHRCRIAWMDSLQGAGDVLIAGIGHGHFLRDCARRFPAANFTCVDASSEMLRQAEARARRSGIDPRRLTFVHAVVPQWTPPPDRFDAIATHFFLDCFPEPELAQVIATLARGGRAHCRWLLSDFTVPPRGWSRHRALLIHRLMYGFFRRLTKIQARRLTDPAPPLRAHGFKLQHRQTSEWGLLHSDCWVRGRD